MLNALLIVLALIFIPLIPYLTFKKYARFINHNDTGQIIAKIWMVFTTFNIAFSPAWLYLLVIAGLHPEGFWQKLVVLIVGIYCLGLLQLILFVVWLWIVFLIIVEL